MIVILLVIGAITLLYFYITKHYTYWDKKNVATGKFSLILGDNSELVWKKLHFLDSMKINYEKLPNARYRGSYNFFTPILLVKSPNLIKQMLVKDFDHFLDRKNFMPEGVDELWSKNLSILKGQTWKTMRSRLSPSFTSRKMKSMFVLICNNANFFVQHFLKKDEETINLEFKDAFTRYTNDVIASVAFGINVDSLGDRENEFYLMGKEATNFNSFSMKMKLILYAFLPKLIAFFKISIISPKVRDFFMNLVKDTIKIREEQNIKRPDMLGLLIEARKGQQKEHSEEINEASFAAVEEHLESTNLTDLTDTDIASQVFIFFLGGFETVATQMCFMAYELAANQDVQKKLIEEIDEVDGVPTYETIANMTYLDMVLAETLRKWPIGIVVSREVTKPYTIQPELPDEQPVHLEIGEDIMVPVYAIHHDPKYYPEPENFDPERFSPENKKNIDPYTYLPFGVGPRNCIGSRFALLEIKAVFFYLLSHFEIVPTEKTTIPIILDRNSINLMPKDGFQLGLKKRF